jgi:hypothetical protein
MEWRGERGWPGLHSERTRNVESLGQACSPRSGLSLHAVGHRTPGRSLNLTAPASTEPTDAKVQPITALNLARVSARC